MNTHGNHLVREDCERVLSVIIHDLDSIENCSILVTGGTGFFGSWFSEMICVLNDGYRKNVKLYVMARDTDRFHGQLSHLVKKPYLGFIRCDVRSVIEVPKDVNYVVHAAATPDYRIHSTMPIETMTSIADGTGAVLRAADRVSDLRMFVNLSSSSVYGPQPDAVMKVPESYDGVSLNAKNKSPYAEAKRYSEALCMAARSEARIPIVTLRPFTFLGAYQNLDAPWAINNFMNDALQNRPIRILGDGQTVRSFMYGADFAAWVLVMMLKGKSGNTYNVGSDIGFPLSEIARKVARYSRPVPDVVLNASLTGTVPKTILVPDTEAARRDFSLTQYTDIDTAIERTLAWYRYRLDNQ